MHDELFETAMWSGNKFKVQSHHIQVSLYIDWFFSQIFTAFFASPDIERTQILFTWNLVRVIHISARERKKSCLVWSKNGNFQFLFSCSSIDWMNIWWSGKLVAVCELNLLFVSCKVVIMHVLMWKQSFEFLWRFKR